MKSALCRRVLGAIVAGWFGALSADVAALHACEMHRTAVPASADVAHEHASTSDRPHPDRAHHCTCLGDCSGANPLTFSETPRPPMATVARRDASVVAAHNESLPGRPDHLLPYATAPPPSVIA